MTSLFAAVAVIGAAIAPSPKAAPCADMRPVVAVLDTGADVAGLSDSLWSNPGETGLDPFGRERATNGIDDDGNGRVDDVHGWNFLDESNELVDHAGHGTHVAGLVARSPVRLMILKYSDPASRSGRRSAAFVGALSYAVKMGANLVHVSGGGFRKSRDEWRILQEAERRGIMVVAASGNKVSGSADRPFYPAAYPLPNVLSVAATDELGRPLPTTNLNPGKDNVLERGWRVPSLLPGGGRGEMTGTSQAAGLFTGKLLSRITLGCDTDFFKRTSSLLRSMN